MRKEISAIALISGVVFASVVGTAAAPKIALEFNGADPVKQMPAAMKGTKVDGGILSGSILAADPSFGFDFTKLKVSTDDIPIFSIRMKVDATEGKPFSQLKLYFSTSDSPQLAEDKTVYISDIVCDGEWHDYTCEMDSNSNWTGLLKSLRVDFEQISDASFKGTAVAIDWLRLDF